MSIRTRLLLIAGLIALSIFYLVPRNVTLRERDIQSGVMTDRTEKRVPLKLGLDLQGGMHLALELDQSKQVSADPKRDLQLALTVLRKRIDEFGVTEPLIQQVGDDRIVVELAGIKDPVRAKAIVQRSAFLEFKITDETRALEKALPAMDRALRSLGIKSEIAPAQPSAVQQLLGGDSAKAGASDTAGAKDTTRADTAAVIGGVLSGLVQPSSATGAGDTPGEYVVPETAFPRADSLLNLPAVARQLPRGIILRWSSAPTSVGVEPVRFLYALNEKSIVTGRNLVDAQAQLDPLTNGPIVTFELDRRGGRTFGEETGRHVGDYMAILLDGRAQGRPPVIQSRINRNGQITLAGRTLQEAQDLALTLKAGALPIPLKIVEERQVGPTLGEDAIRSGIIAGIIGTLFVIAAMVLYYRTAGALAVVALALYALLTLGALAMLDATLTLPGLAGLVLSIGIAVDANVLIFERIREELAAGKTVALAVDEGFTHAMSAIVDSNVTTVLTGLFLFQFGTGPVQGFAVTLILGIIASMISAIFVTRTLFILWLNRKPAMATLSI
ncbi:MAG: protein translocase subunit SecD [Gemmatimonadales bacterium]|nr:protein translocase subunit SecD [Gemmatimonadales bacterium]